MSKQEMKISWKEFPILFVSVFIKRCQPPLTINISNIRIGIHYANLITAFIAYVIRSATSRWQRRSFSLHFSLYFSLSCALNPVNDHKNRVCSITSLCSQLKAISVVWLGRNALTTVVLYYMQSFLKPSFFIIQLKYLSFFCSLFSL